MAMRYYGNLAIDDSSDLSYHTDAAEKIAHRKGVDRTSMKKKKKSAGVLSGWSRNAVIIIEVMALALAAAFMISKFVSVHEGRTQISELETKLANAEAATSQKAFELDQSVDLAQIEKEATTRLGMQRPEKYQTIYINVPMDDVTNTTAGEVEGVDNSIKSFFGNIVRNIVDYFSID